MTLTVKKALFATILIAISVVFAGTSVAGETAEAAPGFSNLEELKNIGYDLEGYDASVTYYSYTLNTSGVYFAFEVTLDKEFLLRAGSVEDCVYRYPDMLGDLENMFSAAGYKVQLDEFNGQILSYMEFASTTDYYVATGRDGYEVSENSADKKTGFLFTDYYSSSKTPFSNIGSEGNFLDVIYRKLKELGATEDKILLTYVYGTPYKTITSDADKTGYNYERNIYTHSFEMTIAEKDRVINLKNHSPNAWGFYILAIACAVPFIAVPITVAVLRKKKQEEKHVG